MDGLDNVAEELHRIIKSAVTDIAESGREHGKNPDALVLEGELMHWMIRALAERMRALPDIGLALATEVATYIYGETYFAQERNHVIAGEQSGAAIARAMRRAAETRRPRKP